MSDESAVSLTRGIPESVIPAVPQEWLSSLDAALATPLAGRRDAIAHVAARFPRMLAAWASLAELAGDDIAAYAYARVGYHRGLDALRQAGWRGTGFVRFREESNRGFLRCLEALRAAAGEIGEFDEEERCRLFLYQLDPDWAKSTRK